MQLETAVRVVPKAQNAADSRKTVVGTGFLPNYLILGIGWAGVLAYPSSALNFPVQSVFLRPPDTAIRWLFSWALGPRGSVGRNGAAPGMFGAITRRVATGQEGAGVGVVGAQFHHAL